MTSDARTDGRSRTSNGRVTTSRTGRAVHVVLDRPAAKNALTTAMVDDLTRIVTDLRHDETADVVVLTGAGTDFCAGADFGDIAALLSQGPAERAATFEQGLPGTVQPLMRALIDLEQSLVVGARGHAIGLGAAFVLAADLVVLSETARVTLPQVKLGHTVDHGESWLLPRKVGLARAMQLCLLGDRVSALDAERFGLANWVTADHDLEERTDTLVHGLLSLPRTPLRRTKALLARSNASLDDHFAAEVRSAAACAATSEFVDAIEAQLTRRR